MYLSLSVVFSPGFDEISSAFCWHERRPRLAQRGALVLVLVLVQSSLLLEQTCCDREDDHMAQVWGDAAQYLLGLVGRSTLGRCCPSCLPASSL